MTRFSRFTKIKFPLWTLPVALLGLALVAFAPLLPRLGFYWDDWAQLFAYRVSGASGFWAYFANDRPLSAWTSFLFSPLFGYSSIGWHMFTLGLRWLAALALWWLLREIWPERAWVAAVAALLFLIYPAFSQQSIGVAYHQHWLQYALFLLSLAASAAASARAVQRPAQRIPFTLLALAAQVLQLSITEYFVFSELLRPAIFFVIHNNQQADDPWRGKPEGLLRWRCWLRPLKQALSDWAPYLVVLIGYILWRLFFLRLPGGTNQPLLLSRLFSQPVSALAQLANSAVWDMLWILVASWARVFNLTLAQTAQPFTLVAWGTGLLAGVLFAVYLARLSEPVVKSGPEIIPLACERRERAPHWTLQALLLGGLALLLGPAPVWMLGAGNILSDPDPYHSDRYALAALFGAVLLIAALIDWAGRDRLQKAALAGLMIGLSVGYQLRTANDFRWLWVEQARFFQQLAWRAPSLAPGSAVITEEIIFPYQGNFSTASALNLLYPQTQWPERVDHWVYALLPRLANHTPEQGPAGLNTKMRTSNFSGSTASSIFVEYDHPWQNCLWVLRPVDQANPYLSDFYKSWLSDSYRKQIRDAGADPAGLPGPGFNALPSNDWCYFFEKSELAVQQADWARAARLGDQALAAGYHPDRSPAGSAREWLAIIEGYARVGKLETARTLTMQSYRNDLKSAGMLCAVWKDVKEGGAEIKNDLRCESLNER